MTELTVTFVAACALFPILVAVWSWRHAEPPRLIDTLQRIWQKVQEPK